MKSRIFTGKVMHARRIPVQHCWTLPFYFYAIDIDELELLEQNIRGFGVNRWSPVSLRDADYLRGQGRFREQLAEFVDLAKVDRIVLVTVARFLRKVFNPVSFYYCLRTDGSLECMVAEVNNTFGERHLYVLSGGDHFPFECRHDKQFHVSPFNNMEGHYEFNFSEPGAELRIEIKLVRDGETVMNAAMWGSGKELTTSSLWQTILAYPLTAASIMPRIIRHAAILHYKKKMPVFKRPQAFSPMTIITKPERVK